MIGRPGPAPTPSGRAPELVLAEVLLEQQERFDALDPMLPAAVPPPPGDLVVTGDATREVTGVVTHHTWPTGSGPLLWSAAEVTELHPVLGGAGADAAHALMREWRSRIGTRTLSASDSAAMVTWPSRDAAATRVFLDHGLVPLAVLAIRPPAPPAAPADTGAPAVRRAGRVDLDACVRLAMAEVTYSSQVGGSVVRPHAEAVKRHALRERLERGDPVWLAERDGVAVGMLECGHSDVTLGSWLAGLLPSGRWGYVNCASVLPDQRGAGAGRALVAAALPELQAPGVCGTYLYYNPPNPLSSVFWPRQGYRPLWTLWEVRPAAALR